MSETENENSSYEDENPRPTLEGLKLLRNARAMLSEAGASEQYRKINVHATEAEVLTHKIIQKDLRISNKAMVLQHYNQKVRNQDKKKAFDLEENFWFENYPIGNGGKGKNKYTFNKIETLVYKDTGYKKSDFTQDEALKTLEKRLKQIVDAEGKKTLYMNPTKTFAFIYAELINIISQKLITNCAEEMKNLTEDLLPSIKSSLVEQVPLMANALKTVDLNLQQLVLEQFSELVGKTAYLMNTTNEIVRGIVDERETNENLLQKVREHQILFPTSTNEQTWREPLKRSGKDKTVRIKRQKPRLSNYRKFFDSKKDSRKEKDRSRRSQRSRSRGRRRRRSKRKTQHSESKRYKKSSYSRSTSRRGSRSRERSESRYSRRSRSRSTESTNRKRKRSLSIASAKSERSQSLISEKNPNKKQKTGEQKQ